MKILIVYGTTEGQTRKIAMFMADRIRGVGNEVSLVDSTEIPEDLDVETCTAVIVAGSVHQGHHQASLFQFVRDHLATLQSKPSAFVSVSLSMAGDDPRDRLDAAECADRFLDVAAWKPTVIHLAAGALRYTQYDFFKRWILKMIAGAKGASTDTGHDHEFTDWRDLEAFVDRFLAQLAERPDGGDRPSRQHRSGEEAPSLFSSD
jgi:menaquinone-dependent protoporphyrinogen oxidase